MELDVSIWLLILVFFKNTHKRNLMKMTAKEVTQISWMNKTKEIWSTTMTLRLRWWEIPLTINMQEQNQHIQLMVHLHMLVAFLQVQTNIVHQVMHNPLIQPWVQVMINLLPTEQHSLLSISRINHPFTTLQIITTCNLQVHQCTIKVPFIHQLAKQIDQVKAIHSSVLLTTLVIMLPAQYIKLSEVEILVTVPLDQVQEAILQLTTVLIIFYFNISILDNTSSPRYSPTTPNYNQYSP